MVGSRHSKNEMDDADGFMAVYQREREAVMVVQAYWCRRVVDASHLGFLASLMLIVATCSGPGVRLHPDVE